MVTMKKLFFVVITICLAGCNKENEPNWFRIENPYHRINSALRVRSTSHEHITTQARLEECLNRGIEVLCAVNYQPSVPSMPINGWSATYYDYRSITDFTIISRTFSNGFKNFTDKKGNFVDLNQIVQLPNSEKCYVINSPIHANFIGSLWGDPGISNLPGLLPDEHPKEFRALYKLYTWDDVFKNIAANLMFENKCFGTLNHPEHSLAMHENLVKYSYGLIKGMEIFNQGYNKKTNDYFKDQYDALLKKEYRLWCLAVADWAGSRGSDSSVNFDMGCSVLLLDDIYLSKTLVEKAEMALDAYIEGSFYASGLGSFDIIDVTVSENEVMVKFSEVVDFIIIDIDSIRTRVENTDTVSALLGIKNTFARFEAYKGDDFIYTNPFFVTKGYSSEI